MEPEPIPAVFAIEPPIDVELSPEVRQLLCSTEPDHLVHNRCATDSEKLCVKRIRQNR